MQDIFNLNSSRSSKKTIFGAARASLLRRELAGSNEFAALAAAAEDAG
jgi:hypothetical protein